MSWIQEVTRWHRWKVIGLSPVQIWWKCHLAKGKERTQKNLLIPRDACPRPELVVERRDAAWVTRPWLHNSSNLTGYDANASAIRVRQIEAYSKTMEETGKKSGTSQCHIMTKRRSITLESWYWRRFVSKGTAPIT